VAPAQLLGANRQYAESTLPTLATLLRASPQAVVQEADVLVVTQRDAQLAAALEHLRPEQLVVDLVRVRDLDTVTHHRYEGICW
jgi:GDP-mannose 6-dehydrogenase